MPDKEARLKLFKVAQNIASTTGRRIIISEAPTDPEEKDKWADQMVRIQIAMWVDEGAKCAHCGYQYKSVDDFLDKKPKSGYDGDLYVDGACWEDDKKVKGK